AAARSKPVTVRTGPCGRRRSFFAVLLTIGQNLHYLDSVAAAFNRNGPDDTVIEITPARLADRNERPARTMPSRHRWLASARHQGLVLAPRRWRSRVRRSADRRECRKPAAAATAHTGRYSPRSRRRRRRRRVL